MKTNLTHEDKDCVGFYTLHNPETDETYAGSGILKVRNGTHFRQLEGGRLGRIGSKGKAIRHPNYKLQQAYNRNPNFEFTGIAVGHKDDKDSRLAALAAEQSLLDEFFGQELFLNLAPDATVGFLGQKHSEASNEKNRQATQARMTDPEFRKRLLEAQNEGRANMSEEDKAKQIAIATEGIRRSYENPDRKRLLGQTRSDEFKERNGAMAKKLWEDPEYRRNQLEVRANTIQPHSKSVSADGVIYPSLSECARAFGFTKGAILYRVSSNSFPNWFYEE